jgi:hypothetical protein
VSLLDLAAADLRTIVEDASGGFAVPVTVIDPNGDSVVLNGLQNDVAYTIDPETGLAVSGRRVSVTLSLVSLEEAGLGQPCGIPDKSRKPWRMMFTAPTGAEQTFKVVDALPDKLGCLVCILEVYRT